MPWSIWLVTDCVFEIFFDSRRSRSSMFLKSMLPPKFSWYVLSIARPRSSNRRASRRCVIVAPTWLLMSSPTIGTPASVELLRPLGVARDEHRDRVHEADAGVERGLRVVALRVLGADREVRDEHVGARVAQRLRDVDRLGRRLLDDLAVELAETVEGRAALHEHAELGDVGELDRVVDARRRSPCRGRARPCRRRRRTRRRTRRRRRGSRRARRASGRGRARSGRRRGRTRRPARGCSRSCRRRRSRRGRVLRAMGLRWGSLMRLLLRCRSPSCSSRSCAISSSIHARSCWVDWARCSRSDRV